MSVFFPPSIAKACKLVEKRLVIFLVCSVLILTGHMLLTRALLPPRPVDQQVAGDADDPPPSGKDGAAQPERTPPAAQNQRRCGRCHQPPPKPTEIGPAESETPEATAPPAIPDVPQQWMTLGSYAADSPYQLLVTLTNRGASIERVELVERRSNGQLRYRDLESQYGYSGLQCQDTDQGCVVTVVGPGTPAAVAHGRVTLRWPPECFPAMCSRRSTM